MPGTEFRLLYDIEVLGIDALDAVSKKTAQVSLDTKYSEAAFGKLERQINRLVISGESYRSALDRISAASRKFGQESSDLARDILRNDEARRRSMAETTKAAEREAQAQQRSANLAYQTNMRIWREEERERLRLERETAAGGTERQRVALHGLRTASVLSGIRDSRSIDAFFGSLGGGAAIAGVGGALAVGATVNLVRNAASSARELQNMADELGLSASQAFKLEAAANLTGEKLGMMSQAAHRLADALDEPGTTGKKTAETLTKLGVSLNQGMGPALEQTLRALNAIEDPAKRDAAAFQLFGREGNRILQVAKNLDQVGQHLDEDVQQKLLAANRAFANLGNTAKIVSGEIVANIVSIGQAISRHNLVLEPDDPIDDNARQAKHLKEDATKALDRLRARNRPPIFGSDRLWAAVHNNSKESIDDRLQKARDEYFNEVARAKDMYWNEPDIHKQDAEAKKVNDLRAAYEKLEAAKKAASRDPNTITDLIANYRGQVNVNEAERDPVAMAKERLRRQIQEAQKEGASKAQLDQIRSIGVDDYFHALKQRKDQQNEFFSKVDAAAQQQYIRDIGEQTSAAFSGTDRAAQALMFPTFNAQTITAAKLKAEQDAKDRQFQRLQLEFESGTIERQFGQLSNQRRAAGTDTANQTYRDRMEMAQRMYDLQVKQASLEQDTDRRALDMQRAKYDYIASQDAARIERENKIAEITERQTQETRNFVTGLFDASISGQPNATSNFFRSFGRNIVGQIVGNIGEDTLGTLNSKLTLQRDSSKPGILGTEAHPNFLARAFRGTFFGFDPAGGKGTDVSSKFMPLITETNRNTDATQMNSRAIAQLTNSLGSFSGIGQTAPVSSSPVDAGGNSKAPERSIPLPSPSEPFGGIGIRSPLHLPSIHAIPPDLTKAISHLGTSVGALQPLQRLLGPGFTSGFAGPVHLHAPNPKAPPPIDLSSEYAPNDVLRSLGTSLGPLPATPPPFQPNSADKSMDAVLASISKGDIGLASKIEQKQQDPELSTATGIANTLAKIFGGAKYTESGHGLAGVLTGGMDLGNGTGVALNKMERLGLGLGIGAQAAGGTYEAIQGFGKGGARGDVQGVAGTMAAIAPFAGPAAPFLEAGAAITGLISSLFPDPRQERIRQMQKNLEHSAYLMPAARDYNYASGSDSGFALGNGGSVRAGGPNANYTLNLSANALDAGSFLDHARQNPEAWSQTMLLAMTSSDAAAVQSLVSWQSQNGGSVPNIWQNSGR